MRRGSLRNIIRAHDGTAAIEFAIVAVPLLMLALGIFEFARIYWTQEALQESATAGARCVGILQSSCASGGVYSSGNAASYVETVASGWGITVPGADVTITNAATCGGVSGFSQVSINFTYVALGASILPASLKGKLLQVQSCYPNNS
ncbi:MAG TPA: TadE/TadG family type IV pilus assembly protein [Rhizomicrobium sp.]